MPLSWIALNSVKGLGPVRIGELLKQFSSPEAVFDTEVSVLRNMNIIPQSCVEEIQNRDNLFACAQAQLNKAREEGVEVLTLKDPRYPIYLKEIFAPPPVLFAKGDISVLNLHAVAVVGTRTPSPYGKGVATALCSDIASRGLVIVSGMAKGVDTLAHRAALHSGAKTVAVLGSGIDIIYPRSNVELSEEIVRDGVLISEFPLGTAPEAFNFPRRNRIISGLAAGTVVVEAGARSGSLITAKYATDQNREVFAVPGPITSPLSEGTFDLLKSGAIPVRNALDIVESIRFISGEKQLNSFSAREKSFDTRTFLSDPEKLLYETLSFNPVRIDEIAERLNKGAAELFDGLLNLELKGLIRQIGGQQYVRVI
ncbi:DNA protecting protein DprA [Chitinispirillum alkaliphilum]|nr:DNA protecting protein DprA [Chitinispirillum alkaliphilum]